jgi:hypothetical protein
MITMLQAIERQLEQGMALDAPVHVKDLLNRFQPEPRTSLRALLQKMLEGKVNRASWAVLLCRFKDLPGNPAIENLFRGMFRPGATALVEYWRDVSLGVVDISGSRVMGWFELDITREQAGGKNRRFLIDKAVQAAKRSGQDPESGFFSQIAVFTHDWARDDAPRLPEDQLGKYWIDGSSDGHRVSAPPHLQNGAGIAHEMGHGFDLTHDLKYGDPYSIMSYATSTISFLHPALNVLFGPEVSLPHLIRAGWMYHHRVFVEDVGWLARSEGITIPLSPISELSAHANLGIMLSSGNDSDYCLEYVTPTGWNQAIPNAVVAIRLVPRNGGEPLYLGKIIVPMSPGTQASFQHSTVQFNVSWLDNRGRILKVTAKKV